MKKFIPTLLLAAVIFWTANIDVSALNMDLSDAVITADEGGLLIIHDEDASEYFIDLDDLEPGQSITRAYIIKNDYKNPYQLYLRATKPVSIPIQSNIANKIMLKITIDGALMYHGTVGGGLDEYGNTLDNNIFLGEVDGKTTRRMKAEFYLDGPSIGNESQGAKASVDWVWTAIIPNGVEPPVDPKVPEEPEEEDNGPSFVDSLEKEKTGSPKTGSPKTGDYLRLGALITAFFAALCILLAEEKRNKMKNCEEEQI